MAMTAITQAHGPIGADGMLSLTLNPLTMDFANN